MEFLAGFDRRVEAMRAKVVAAARPTNGVTTACSSKPALDRIFRSGETAKPSSVAQDALKEGFANPPNDAKSRVWWHWMNGNVTKAGITADLEAMAAAGIGGAHIFDVGCAIPPGGVKFNTPAWDEHVRFAAREAERLGLELTLANCSGFANAGGPWVAPSNSMFRVTSSAIVVRGSTRIAGPLPRTAEDHGFYRDIAVLAFPRPACETDSGLRVESPSTNVFIVSSDRSFVLRGVSIEMKFPQWSWHRYLDATLETSNDGRTWRKVGTVTEQVVYSGQEANGEGRSQLIAFARPVEGRFIRISCDTSRSTVRAPRPCRDSSVRPL